VKLNNISKLHLLKCIIYTIPFVTYIPNGFKHDKFAIYKKIMADL